MTDQIKGVGDAQMSSVERERFVAVREDLEIQIQELQESLTKVSYTKRCPLILFIDNWKRPIFNVTAFFCSATTGNAKLHAETVHERGRTGRSIKKILEFVACTSRHSQRVKSNVRCRKCLTQPFCCIDYQSQPFLLPRIVLISRN